MIETLVLDPFVDCSCKIVIVGPLSARELLLELSIVSRCLDLLPGRECRKGLQAKIDPDRGPVDGGTEVRITGNGFTNASAVNFGTRPGTAFAVENDGLITVTSPAGAANSTVDVVVVWPGNTPPNLPVGRFTYTT